MTKIDRRVFLGTSAFAGIAAIAPFGAPAFLRGGTLDEVRIAVVGVNGRGRDHYQGFEELEGVRVVALCDVDRQVLAARAAAFEQKFGRKVDTVVDVRRLLERGDIDAVSIATPNHWHALATIWACEAGKDVYVEKPVSHNVLEGRRMVEVARATGRIVQAGMQSRSSPAIRDAIAWLRGGNLGKIELARGLCYKPRPSIGNVAGAPPVPDAIDYDLWCGPAPQVPLARKNLHYDWHWLFATGNGDLGNQGVHQMDIARFAIGAEGFPKRVVSFGGRFGYDDDANTPNTQVIHLETEPAPIIFEVRGLPRDRAAQGTDWGKGMDRHLGVSIGTIIHCEGGSLVVPNYSSAYALDRGGERIREWSGGMNHFQNFIDSVRSRRREDLTADIEEGHLSSAYCHLGNISYQMAERMPFDAACDRAAWPASAGADLERMRAHLVRNGTDVSSTEIALGPVLEIDRETERFVGAPEADSRLTREYRAPFTLGGSS